MKQVVVIIEPPTDTDLVNVLKAATNNQKIPIEILRIGDTAFLIDIHKSLAFFSGLVHSVHIRNIPYFVFAVEDILHVPKGHAKWGQEN